MIAGPLFQIRTKLEKYVSTKEFEPIKLRKGDKINEIADLINQSIEMAKNTAKNSKNENIELRNWACRQDRTATFCMGK